MKLEITKKQGGFINIYFKDKHMQEYYHPIFDENGELFSIGMYWSDYCKVFLNRNDCYYATELKNHLKGLNKIYGEAIIIDYSFKGIDFDLSPKHRTYEIGEQTDLYGDIFSSFVEAMSVLRITDNTIVDEINIVIMFPLNKKQKRIRTNVPRGLRHEVFKRDNYTCVECGAKKEDGATLHIDHIIPVSKGGSDEMNNLQTLCSDCNLNKSNLIQ